MANLSVKINRLSLKNPVMTASGTFGYGLEYADFIPLEELGGIIVKGTTLQPRQGNDYPRMAETPQGMLNCVGLQNKGVDYFCEHIYPQIKDIQTNFIVNVSGNSPQTYAECAQRLASLENIPAIELNISCPNVKQGGIISIGTKILNQDQSGHLKQDLLTRTVSARSSVKTGLILLALKSLQLRMSFTMFSASSETMLTSFLAQMLTRWFLIQ